MVSIGRAGEEGEGEELWGMVGWGNLQTSTWKTSLGSHLGHSWVGESQASQTPQNLRGLLYKTGRQKTLPYLLTGFYEEKVGFSLYKTGFTTCDGVNM